MPKIFQKTALLALSVCLVLAHAPLHAEVRLVDADQLQAREKHQRAIDIITHIATTYHYRQTELDDAMSKKIFDNYFDSLDPNRSFLTHSDIERFSDYRTRMDDAMRDGELGIAFDIFKHYRQCVKERVDYALSQLDQEFDFDTDERYRYDRQEMPWPENDAELRDIWDKRIKNDYLLLKLTDKSPDDIRETLRKRYERIVTSTFQLKADDVFQTFVNAYTTAIEPHTAYFSPRTSENFDISMRLSLEGIGAVLSGETDYTEVQRIVTGGPADMSGELEAEDRIIGVAQGEEGEMVDVIGWRLDDVVDLIRGPKGSIVRLEVLPKGMGPGGPTKTIELERNKIKLEQQAAKSEVLELDGTSSRVGVIDIPTFYMDFAAHQRGDKDYRSTTRDVRKLIDELRDKNVDGLVIDLRGNGGGSLTEALELTGLFISGGPIVQTKDSSGRIEVNEDPDPELFYQGPLAVLVDRNSASASEIFAGAIQDYKRGIVIGEPTFGKGTVQNIIDLSRFDNQGDEELGRLKTTIAQFFRISGGSNQHRGVVPDIVYPTAHRAEDSGERSYENALPWDSVRPAKFEPAAAPTDKFDVVRDRHEQRIADNESFAALLERTRFLEQQREDKTVSLNLEKRKQERERLEAEQEELDEQYHNSLGMELEPEDDSDSKEEGDSDKPDILLREAARILNDLIVPTDELPKQLHADKKASAN
ncbi:carboxyl-terminal processing protease [Methylohalomonas lacus]|uniref:Carboxyl-terminal processing protease n=1 Tax=Methylohalomonas lacus TaxID=398773 RepID=A0AAE3L513_9GAMM|nr:carboxy terminal-processing peptidase [Methylohalomonas lacus]MCS3902502.1 carboxyl-terminal processing protease [Methylohalomonas lacus]